MKTKLIFRLIVITIIVLFFHGCKLSTETETLNIALFKAPASESLIKLLPEFEKETGIKVNYEVLPYQELKTKIEQQFSIKSDYYDIIMSDCIWIPSFVERGNLGLVDTSVFTGNYDLNDLLPELDNYLSRYPHNGPRYGMPFMSNTHMMIYRKSVVETIAKSLGFQLPGIDKENAWTWEQYKEVAMAITQIHKKDTIYGTSLQARAGAWIIYEWYSVLFGFSNDSVARVTGLPPFNEEALNAIQYYAELYRNAAPVKALTWGHEEETSAMCSGLCAMDATSNVELASSFYTNNCNVKDLAFAFPPIGVSGQASPDMGGYGLMLNKFSKKSKNASLFLMWATSKEIHNQIVLQGGTPIRKSQIINKEILNKYPYLSFYDKLIDASVYRARIPKWPELEDVLSREIVKAMKNEISAKEANENISNWIQNNIK